MTIIDYEVILNRKMRTISFSQSEVEFLRNQRVLITGAGGSIGSRITHALAKMGGVKFLATDRDESALHTLSLELTSSALFEEEQFLLLDVRDPDGVVGLFEQFKPTTVIHAAALKHLSVLEKQPRESMLTNVYGTLNLLQIAKTFGVTNFVNISTDKAASPTSVLGRSKFLTELMAARFNTESEYRYTSVRFGNVFGSRGSVIETFFSQIKKGMPITLTHPGVSRYFMHQDEAAYLTVKSILLESGDLHLLNMGEPVLILNLAISLQKFLEGTSNIVFTGLRPGEKIEEDLFLDVEGRQTVIPNLVDAGFHEYSLIRYKSLIEAAINRESETILEYLKSGEF